jgi:cytochrome P450
MNAKISQIPAHVAPDRVFDFDIYFDAGLRENLHVAYAQLHQQAPEVFYTPANGGHWMITSYDAIAAVVTDPEHFSAAEMQIPRMPNPPQFIPLNLDPPDNIPYRQLLMPFFSPKAIAGMRARVEMRAREVVHSVAARGHCNFLDEIASPFPVSIFMELMGYPVERLPEFRRLALRYFAAREDQPIREAFAAIAGELVEIIELKRLTPGDDLVSKLVTAKLGDRLLNMDELTKICFLLFLGGLDTVTNASSFTAQFLARSPALQDRLLADPDSVEPFVEEAIRMFGVVNTPRLVAKDCEKFGVRFLKGEMVLCNLPLAGWDEAKNPHPEVFDIDRKNRSSLMFSTGPHLCLGHFLARLEMRALFAEWMKTIGRFRLADGFRARYRPGTVSALESLELVWEPPLRPSHPASAQ